LLIRGLTISFSTLARVALAGFLAFLFSTYPS
jgi:hypothetical protein